MIDDSGGRNVTTTWAPDDQTFDFGTGFVGDTINHSFRIENPSQGAITVLDVASTCACTVPGAAPDRIPARSSVEIPVRVHLERQGERFGQAVIITLAEHDPVELRIEGRVLLQMPRAIDFGRVSRGDEQTRRFLVRSRTAQPVTILGIQADARYFSVNHSPDDEIGAGTSISVRLAPGIPEGSFQKEIRVITDDTPGEKVITARGYVVPPVEIEPRSPIAVGGVARDGATPVAIRIYSPFGRTVTVELVETYPEAFLTWESLETTQAESKVVLRITGDFEQRVLKAKADVHARIDNERYVIPVAIYAMREVEE